MRLRSNFPRRTEPTTRALGRALALLVLGLSTLTLGSTLGACEQQGEGERCEIANGDADCAAGLVCKSASELGGETDYCCPASGSANPVCIPGGNTGGSGTGGGGTGGGGTGGTGGGGTGGTGGGGTGGLGGGGTGGGGTGGGGTGGLGGGGTGGTGGGGTGGGGTGGLGGAGGGGAGGT